LLSLSNFQTLIFVFSVSILAYFISRAVASKFKIIDHPGGRKIHSSPVLLSGGLMLVLIMSSTLFIEDLWSNALAQVFFGSLLLFFVGLADDIKSNHYFLRLSAQVLITLLTIFNTDIHISHTNIVFLDQILQQSQYVSIVFTTICVVGLVNAFNLIDGIDGLATLIVLTALSFIIFKTNISDPVFVLFLASAIFLFLNIRKKNKIFLGDSGSLFLGFFLSWILIINTQSNFSVNPEMAIWLVAMPIYDTLSVIIRRIKEKKSIFTPGNDHLHHLLLKRTNYQRTMIVFLSCIIFLLIVGIILSSINSSLSYLGYVFFFIIYQLAVTKKFN